jgi:hypothetical protein
LIRLNNGAPFLSSHDSEFVAINARRVVAEVAGVVNGIQSGARLIGSMEISATAIQAVAGASVRSGSFYECDVRG